MNWIIEGIGITATLFILVSMCFKTLSYKGSLWMRILNITGSVVFVVYGALLPAISTAVLNGALVLVNSYHVFILIKEHKKQIADENQEKIAKNKQEQE